MKILICSWLYRACAQLLRRTRRHRSQQYTPAANNGFIVDEIIGKADNYIVLKSDPSAHTRIT